MSLEDNNQELDIDQTENDYADEIATILSNEPEPEPEPEVKPEPIPDDIPVKIKIRGEELEVPLSELKNGYQRQADYTQKTQELSQERQVIEQQKQQWEQYVSSIPVLANVAQQNAQQAQDKLFSDDMIKLAQTDPAEYIAQKAELERIVLTNQQSLESMQQHWDQHQYELQNQVRSVKEQEFAKTSELFTQEYGEDWTSGKIYKELIDYGSKIGFTKDDIDSLSNYNVIATLNKARLYDELISNKNIVQKQVEKIPPKTTKVQNDGDLENDFKTKSKKALKNFERGDDSDLADLIAGLL